MKRAIVGAALTTGVSAVAVIRSRRRNNIQTYEQQPAVLQEENEPSIDSLPEDTPHNLFRNLKWPTLIGNLGIGAAEVLAGGSSTLAVTVDGVHNVGDAGGYAAQFYAEEAKQPERVRRLRKIGHWVIASSSAIVGAKAAYDLAVQNEHTVQPAGLAAAFASLALNGYLGRDIIPKVQRHGWKRLSGAQRDIAKHFALVDAPSSILAVGGAVAAGAAAHEASAAAAVASGAIGAWVFRPTSRNLAEPHVCASHGHHEHSHESGSPVHHAHERQKVSKRRSVALLGAASMAAAGIVMGAASPVHGPVSQSYEHEAVPDRARESSVPQEISERPLHSAAEIYTVQPDDLLWTIVEDNLCQPGGCSNQEIIDRIDKIVERNEIDNPDVIFPTQQLVL